MATSPSNNPFGNTQLVDRLIGTAYDTVKLLSENLQYVKHVSINLPHIAAVSEGIEEIYAVEAKLAEVTIVANDIANVVKVGQSIDAVNDIHEHMSQLLALYNKLAEVLEVAAGLPSIQTVSDNITEVLAVFNNLNNIQDMLNALPDLMLVLAQKDEILQAKIDAEAARDAAQQYAQDALENSTSIAFASTEEAIAGTSTTRVMSPKTTKDVLDSINAGELVVAPKSFTGIAGTNKTYTLDRTIGGASNVFVFVGNSRQRPIIDYTVSGTTLTILDNPDGLNVDTLIMAGTNEINTLGGRTSDEYMLKTDWDPDEFMLKDDWKQLGVTPRDFDPTAGTGGDDTAAVQAAFDFVGSNGGKLDLGYGPWRASKVVIGTGNEFFELAGNGVIWGISDDAQTCVVEITRGNFTISGTLTAYGQYKANYAAGFWYHNNAQVQSADLNKLVAVGCLVGTRLGDADHGASVTSETTLNAPRTYGCPTAMMVEGYNTFLTVVAPPVLSGDGFGGDATWQALPRHGLITKGVGGLVILGGEIIQTGSGLATNYDIEVRPSVTAGVLYFGRVTLIGVCCETGGPLLKVTNPDGLTGTEDPGRPRMTFIGCLGYHSQDNAPLIETDVSYLGDVVWIGGNMWFPGTRTQPNVKCNNSLTRVYIDDMGFGNGFKSVLNGVQGGIQYFSRRGIVRALGLPATAVVSGGNDLIYNAKDNTGDLAKFNANYDATTGIFTVPAGGFKELILKASVRISGVTGRMYVMERNASGGSFSEVAGAPVASGVGQIIYTIAEAPAGYSYKIGIAVDSGAGAVPSASGYLNRLDIEASR